MRRLLRKLRTYSPDEMEKSILFRAQRNACIFLMTALLLWTLYEGFQGIRHHRAPNVFPGLLLTTALVIQTFSRLVMTRNAVKDDEDSCETGPLVKIVTLGCAVAGMTAAGAAAILLMGVRV